MYFKRIGHSLDYGKKAEIWIQTSLDTFNRHSYRTRNTLVVLHFYTHIVKIQFVYFTDLYNFYSMRVFVEWLLSRTLS